MRWNIVTNTTNGVGLQRDYELVKEFLEARGHKVNGVHFKRCLQGELHADRNLFLEVVVPQMFRFAAEQWIIPNPEWWFPELWDTHLKEFRFVLAKTQDAQRTFSRLVGDRCRYTGFLSREIRPKEPQVRRRAFLHIAGKSQTKNTHVILEAWRRYGLRYPLTIVSYDRWPVVNGVNYRRDISDEELAMAMHSHWFHLCPSQYEGWGHYLHEGMGAGAVVITTDASPMNEFGCPKGLLVKAGPGRKLRYGTNYPIAPDAVRDAVQRAMDTPDYQLEKYSTAARLRFVKDRERFTQNFEALVAEGGA